MEQEGEVMSVWLRYLAIAVLVGNGLTALLNLIGLGRMLLQGRFEGGIDRLALNLALSLAAMALAALIAAPPEWGVSLLTKIIAVRSVLGGAFGFLSSGDLALLPADRSNANRAGAGQACRGLGRHAESRAERFRLRVSAPTRDLDLGVTREHRLQQGVPIGTRSGV